MPVQRKTLSFAQQIAIDRRGDDYVYGGNWDPFQRKTGTDCSGCVVDMLDGTINGTAMEWTRHGLSTEDWRPPSMGGNANPQNGPFGTIMVNDPSQFPPDAAVMVAFHHGPGGGANSHTWCQVGSLKVETNGSDGTVLSDGTTFTDAVLDVHTADGVNGQYGANNWWYLPGPIVEDGTPVPHQPSGVGPAPVGEPQDTIWADVSEFQNPLTMAYFDATYMDAGLGPWNYKVISIRANDGDHLDENFAANYAAATAAVGAGKCLFFFVYYFWRPGSDAVNNMMKMVNQAGGPHPKMVAMIDLESGDGNPSSDVSAQVNTDYYALAQWLSDDRRVIGYANLNDETQMWQLKPQHLPMILAGYGSNPNDPSVFKIGHQYTDGTGYGGGLPEGAPPFGNCDMNSADGFSPSQLAAALGVGDTVPAPTPTPTPVPTPMPVPVPTLPTEQQEIDYVYSQGQAYPQLAGKPAALADLQAKIAAGLDLTLIDAVAGHIHGLLPAPVPKLAAKIPARYVRPHKPAAAKKTTTTTPRSRPRKGATK